MRAVALLLALVVVAVGEVTGYARRTQELNPQCPGGNFTSGNDPGSGSCSNYCKKEGYGIENCPTPGVTLYVSGTASDLNVTVTGAQIQIIYVKGSNGYCTYLPSASKIQTPINPSGGNAGLSHVSVCYTFPPNPPPTCEVNNTGLTCNSSSVSCTPNTVTPVNVTGEIEVDCVGGKAVCNCPVIPAVCECTPKLTLNGTDYTAEPGSNTASGETSATSNEVPCNNFTTPTTVITNCDVSGACNCTKEGECTPQGSASCGPAECTTGSPYCY